MVKLGFSKGSYIRATYHPDHAEAIYTFRSGQTAEHLDIWLAPEDAVADSTSGWHKNIDPIVVLSDYATVRSTTWFRQDVQTAAGQPLKFLWQWNIPSDLGPFKPKSVYKADDPALPPLETQRIREVACGDTFRLSLNIGTMGDCADRCWTSPAPCANLLKADTRERITPISGWDSVDVTRCLSGTYCDAPVSNDCPGHLSMWGEYGNTRTCQCISDYVITSPGLFYWYTMYYEGRPTSPETIRVVCSDIPAPASVSLTCLDTIASLHWNLVLGYSEYEVVILQDNIPYYTTNIRDTMLVTRLTCGPAYSAQVHVALSMNFSYSDTCRSATIPIIPSWAILHCGFSAANCSWAESPGANDYIITLYADRTDIIDVETTTTMTSSFEVENGRIYRFSVVARGLCGQSEPFVSNECESGQPPLDPDSVNILCGDSTIEVTWPPVISATSYFAQVKQIGGSWICSSYLDSIHYSCPIEVGHHYTANIISVNAVGESEGRWSDTCEVTARTIERSEVVAPGWNLLSWSLQPADLCPLTTFPYAYSAYIYSPVTRAYTLADTLPVPPEQGFWLLCGMDTTATVTGQRVDSLVFDVPTPGWVLCGNTTDGATVESLSTVPPGLIGAGTVNVYQPGSGYLPVTTGRIPPGKGFWMLLAGAGRVRVR